MITIKKDLDLLINATESCRDFNPISDLEEWMRRPNNIMMVEGNNVGLASWERPGIYNVHWYFPSARGRTAIELAKKMCEKMFTDYGAMTLCGLIKTRLKASRWAARQVGMKSYGTLIYSDGDENEILFLTKGEFLKGLMNG